MNGLRVFFHRLRAVFLQGRLERELQEEIRSHLDMQTEENLRQLRETAHLARRVEGQGGHSHVPQIPLPSL